MNKRRILAALVGIGLFVVTAGVASAAIQDGLVAYWTFDANMLDTSGSPNVHDGTYVGTGIDTYITAKFGQGIDLPGDDQHVDAGNHSDWNFGGAGNGMTISAWFRVDAFDKSWQALVVRGEGNAFRLHRRSGDQRLAWNAGGGGDLDSGYNTGAGSTPEYHHIAVTHDGVGTKEVWIDGQRRAVSSGGSQIEDRDLPVYIGENPQGDGRNWDGVIDDMGMWGRALDGGEVLAIWNGGAGATIESLKGTSPPPLPSPVARLTGGKGSDILGGAYGESAGVASPPSSWTLEERGAVTRVPGLRETIWDAALPNGDVTGNIENVRAAAAGPLGPNDAQGVLSGHLHYQDDGSVDARAAALGAPGFDAGDFTMLWTTDFKPNESGDWGFRNNNVDDRYSFWIDLDQDGTLESDERFFERGSCCAGSGDRYISEASSAIDSLVADQTYLLGFVMNDTGGGGYFRDMEFKAPSGAWTDLNPSATGDLFTVQDTPWMTLASGSNQVGGVGIDGLFGVSLPNGSHYLRLSVTTDTAGVTETAVTEGDVIVAADIPEPLTMLAVGLGLSGLGGYVRRRKRA